MLAFLDFCRCLTVPQLIARKYNFYKTGRRDSKGGVFLCRGGGGPNSGKCKTFVWNSIYRVAPGVPNREGVMGVG